MTALGVVASTITVPLPTGAHATSSHETWSVAVAAPVVRMTCTRRAGTARARMVSGVGPGPVNGVGVNVVPSHVLLAAAAGPSVAASTSGPGNLVFPARRLLNVRARGALPLGRGDGFGPFFKNYRPHAPADLR